MTKENDVLLFVLSFSLVSKHFRGTLKSTKYPQAHGALQHLMGDFG